MGNSVKTPKITWTYDIRRVCSCPKRHNEDGVVRRYNHNSRGDSDEYPEYSVTEECYSMKGSILLETNIQGHICTNCNREIVAKWRGNIERSLVSLEQPFFNRQKISVELKFWISGSRLRSQRNDLDNLVKPILDSMKKLG